MELTFHPCTTDDLSQLREFSRKTYADAFAAQNTNENMAAYLDRAFAPDRLRRELENPYSSFYFLFVNGSLAGYLKLNEAPAQTDIHAPDSLEIERIYVASSAQGAGLGQILMDKAVSEARARGKAWLWLGVWAENERALRFYRKNGFYQTGEHVFLLGEDRQTDYLMRRNLV